MEHLLAAWTKLAPRLKQARHIFLFFDYDGTLTPIVEKPELANLPETTRDLLQSLVKSPRFKVAIISGRALADLKARVALDGIIYIGNHGLEMEEWVSPLAKEMVPVIRSIERLLQRSLGGIPGLLIENKGFTLSVHYRLVDESQVATIKATLDRILRTALSLGKIVITTGKKVYEVRPAGNWGKGEAVKILIEKFQKNSKAKQLLPVYLGDDTTDESAFKAVTACNGIPILVGEEDVESAALFFLRSPVEVHQLLALLVQYC